MLFGKKSKKNEINCPECKKSVSNKFNFCPYCSTTLFDEAEELEEYGMLGKTDSVRKKENFLLK